jgi:hypothetical protein
MYRQDNIGIKESYMGRITLGIKEPYMSRITLV